jgi:hypothetical protein
MKNLLLTVLAVAGLAYYFDFNLTDLFPTVPAHGAAARERHASGIANPQPAAQPQPSVAATPATNVADGSLANRWQSDPSASPKKP